jgi:predicted transcriptional regulator
MISAYFKVVAVVGLKQRERMNIISLILEVSSNGADNARRTTTKIMHNTLLNHPRLKEYWIALAGEGLVRYDNTTQ